MGQIFKKRSNWIFLLKIDLPALLAFAFFAGLIFFYLIPGFEKVMMDRKREMIHEMTSSAYSILEYYLSLEIKGNLETEEAKEQASAAISTIRYGENQKDYFWIIDSYPHMIVHPYRPDLNGQDLTDFQDSKGKSIFVEFVKAVSNTGESYVDYMWQWNDDSTRITPKLSYVRLFEPWDWIIGTGIYIEDVHSEIRRMEFGALIISGTIGLVIIILLTAISRTSHKIEEKRNKAEEELRKSRELYRTLAEVASEGVMIWSGQGLQANKTLLSWLGYSEEELQTVTLSEILSSQYIPELTDSETLYDELSTRQYVECVLKIKSGDDIKLHADFSRILLGGMRAVMLVMRPVKSYTSQNDFSPQATLMNRISTGFFRTTYGRKIRFLYATESTIEMLGFNNFQDLLHHSIESLFVNPVQLKTFRLALASKENIFKKEVLLRKKGGNKFWAQVSVMIVEFNSQEIWCEGTIEHLAVSSSQLNSPLGDLNTYSAAFIMEAPVYSIMRPPLVCPENFPVSHAVSLMQENNSSFIIITDKNGEPIGVIDTGIIANRLMEGGTSKTEVFKWMDSPPEFIQYDTRIKEAFARIQYSNRKCLLVTTDKNRFAGIITNNELSQAFFTAPELIISEIEKAVSTTAIRNIYLNSRKIAISMIMGHADPYSVSLYLSSIADAICTRLLTLCIDITGEPPCRFAFIQTGSAGRREQTFSTDQDNGIIFENVSGEQLQKANAYFLSLGKKINEMLSITGFRLCKGANMAGNPEWCQPVNRWKKYFSDWIKMPGPSELLEVSIFFDFRFCYGDPSLSDELREYVKTDLKTNDIFFHHMASALKQFNPSTPLLKDKNRDIKRILIPLTGIIRLYSLKYGITSYSTIERILELYSGKRLDYHLLREAIRAWKDLTSMRLSHQASCINNGSEPDNIIDFSIADGELYCFAEQAITTINNLMLKTGNDFYTEII